MRTTASFPEFLPAHSVFAMWSRSIVLAEAQCCFVEWKETWHHRRQEFAHRLNFKNVFFVFLMLSVIFRQYTQIHTYIHISALQEAICQLDYLSSGSTIHKVSYDTWPVLTHAHAIIPRGLQFCYGTFTARFCHVTHLAERGHMCYICHPYIVHTYAYPPTHFVGLTPK